MTCYDKKNASKWNMFWTEQPKQKTCKYVVANSYELFKTSMFWKISDNSTTNENTFRGGYDDKFYIKVFGIYPTIELFDL